MNCVVSLVIKGNSNPVKGLTSTAKHLKTQTNLEIAFETKDRASIDFYGSLTEDIAVLGLMDAPIGPLSFIVSEAQAIGRLHNRSLVALDRIMVSGSEIDWDADAGVLEYTAANGIGADIPSLVELITRMIFRSTLKTSHTRHPLTLFDFKQTTGLVQDLRDNLEGVGEIATWMDARELVVAEAAKAKAAKAAAAKRAEKKEVEAAKAAAEAVVEKKEKVKAKGKAKAKAKLTPEATPETEDLDPNE